MTFSLAMLAARLALGALSSLCAGSVLAWITRGNGTAAKILGIVVTVIFVRVHHALWDSFSAWYHAIFLVSLFPFTLVGASLLRRRNSRVSDSASA